MNWKFWERETKLYNITDVGIRYLGPSAALSGQGVFIVYWSAEGIGFGELTFYNKDDKFCCETECLPKEFVKAVMNALLEKNTKYLDL
jgi:hypothetical protein